MKFAGSEDYQIKTHHQHFCKFYSTLSTDECYQAANVTQQLNYNATIYNTDAQTKIIDNWT